MRANEAMHGIAHTVSSSLTTGLTDIIDGSKSLGDAFQSMPKTIVRAIEEMIVKMLIVRPLMASLSGGLGFADGGLVGSVPGFAGGGLISGPGGPREDKIPAMLSNGEYVINAAATAKHLRLLEAINADRLPRFANGGAIGDARGATFGGSQTIVAPQIAVNVQGSPGVTSAVTNEWVRQSAAPRWTASSRCWRRKFGRRCDRADCSAKESFTQKRARPAIMRKEKAGHWGSGLLATKHSPSC